MIEIPPVEHSRPPPLVEKIKIDRDRKRQPPTKPIKPEKKKDQPEHPDSSDHIDEYA